MSIFHEEESLKSHFLEYKQQMFCFKLHSMNFIGL